MSVRQVMFNPPNGRPAIYWTDRHVPVDVFMDAMWPLGVVESVDTADIQQGWGTRKLSFTSLYLSDEPLPNFEPITYWLAPERTFA